MVAWLAELTVPFKVAFVKIVRCSKITFAEFVAVQYAVPSLLLSPIIMSQNKLYRFLEVIIYINIACKVNTGQTTLLTISHLQLGPMGLRHRTHMLV